MSKVFCPISSSVRLKATHKRTWFSLSELKTSSLIIAIIAGLIAVALFIPIDVVWKVTLLVLLILVGVGDIATNLNWSQKVRTRSSLRSRRSAILRHPELINDLLRLNSRVHQVLYENSADHPSLRRDGETIMKSTQAAPIEEFKEKMTIMERSFSPISSHLVQRRFEKRKWNTEEFAEAVSAIENHLCLVPNVFNTIYRAGQTKTTGSETTWNAFREEYNAVLSDWKVFMSRVTQTVGYVNESQVKNALALPE